MRLNTEDGKAIRDSDDQNVENLLQNDSYADQTMRQRFENKKFTDDFPEEVHQKEQELKFAQSMDKQEI